jgi:hypothetical protein
MLLIPFKTIWKIVSSQGPREFWREFSSPTGTAPLWKPGLDCSEPRWQQLHEAHLDIERSGLAVSAARTRVLFYMHSFNNIILGAVGLQSSRDEFLLFLSDLSRAGLARGGGLQDGAAPRERLGPQVVEPSSRHSSVLQQQFSTFVQINMVLGHKLAELLR